LYTNYIKNLFAHDTFPKKNSSFLSISKGRAFSTQDHFITAVLSVPAIQAVAPRSVIHRAVLMHASCVSLHLARHTGSDQMQAVYESIINEAVLSA
jgi:hypothetical protein